MCLNPLGDNCFSFRRSINGSFRLEIVGVKNEQQELTFIEMLQKCVYYEKAEMSRIPVTN